MQVTKETTYTITLSSEEAGLLEQICDLANEIGQLDDESEFEISGPATALAFSLGLELADRRNDRT